MRTKRADNSEKARLKQDEIKDFCVSENIKKIREVFKSKGMSGEHLGEPKKIGQFSMIRRSRLFQKNNGNGCRNYGKINAETRKPISKACFRD